MLRALPHVEDPPLGRDLEEADPLAERHLPAADLQVPASGGSGDVMSVLIMSCHVMSCHVMSCHVMPCHVISCHVMSCHVMSCHLIMSSVLLMAWSCVQGNCGNLQYNLEEPFHKDDCPGCHHEGPQLSCSASLRQNNDSPHDSNRFAVPGSHAVDHKLRIRRKAADELLQKLPDRLLT